MEFFQASSFHKTLKAILVAGFCFARIAASAQILHLENTPLPCKFDIKLSYKRRFETYGEYYKRDSIRVQKEKQAEIFYNDGIPCVDYYALHDVFIKLILQNSSARDVGILNIFEEDEGIISLCYYKKSKTKLIPLVFENPGIHITERFVDRNQTDSSLVTFISTDFTKIDTGIYIIRGSYKQKCNGTIARKYTNDIYFRVIK